MKSVVAASLVVRLRPARLQSRLILRYAHNVWETQRGDKTWSVIYAWLGLP